MSTNSFSVTGLSAVNQQLMGKEVSTRAADPFAVSREISVLGMRLGALEGQARERGYPSLSDGRLVDCGELVLSVFEKHRESARQMRTELDRIYSKLRIISTNLDSICIPELKEVFEDQIKLLHEKRGVLTHSLDSFDSLLSSHVLIVELENRVVAVRNQVDSFSPEKTGIDSWETINNTIEDLLLRLRIVFPDSNKGMENFCQTHYASKQAMLLVLRDCRSDLGLKRIDFSKKSSLTSNATLEVLFPALQKMRSGRIADQDIENIQKLFGSLSLDLRMFLFAARGLCTEDQIEAMITYQWPPERDASPDFWAEVCGLSYYDSERDLNKYESSVNELLEKCGGKRKAVISERAQAHESLNKFIAQLPNDEISNPKLLLEAFSQIYSKHPDSMSPAVAKILKDCLDSGPEEVKTEVLSLGNLQEVFESRLQNVPALGSLEQIKEQIEAYKGAKSYDDVQRERLVAALLDAAESKGGVSLNADKGVYYWIWFLAHEKDPSAGGDSFGKNNAPKDIDRLITAIERSMQSVATSAQPVNLPAIKIEGAATPNALPLNVRSPTGVPPRPHSEPRTALRPSEVLNRERRLSSNSPIKKEIMVSSPTATPAPVAVSVMTEIKVKCKVPEGHSLSVCGQGGDLDWKVGKKLEKLDAETYVHKMEGVTGKIEYKIVLDDREYEAGANRVIEAQRSVEIVPSLAMPKVAVVVNFSSKDNKLFICGTGPGMSWDQNKKLELKPINGNFVLESKTETGNFEFKILLSDNVWSKGVNFKAENGKTLEITPVF